MGGRAAIDVELARFGRFQTGASIQAKLQVPESNFDGCEEYSTAEEALLKNQHSLPLNRIVMLEDGGCTYEVKARHVQQNGAQALLIVHDPDEYIDHRKSVNSDRRYDGSGSTVQIPTLIMNREDGDTLLDLYRETTLSDWSEHDV
eukprot:CAMPEP_0185613236 /NCGR_PEP_ID=MMETSP0436-20130131/25959_1 /TAXON_ID=626734 ORGANISM="Favella taraikaensis, Strain Fe Narragansett Bay" /NCGR_SAMPLE_ID=MMETSP0436 /ASSEMBLY_ACC=CAM_ASM_000390 /LENGTH=145 /DNA_ID=CAMNT_0028247159 /DNA_START=106 /DNA_END=538 /DNA_ORIENTATION=-